MLLIEKKQLNRSEKLSTIKIEFNMKFIVFAVLVLIFAFAHTCVAFPHTIEDLVARLGAIARAGGTLSGDTDDDS